MIGFGFTWDLLRKCRLQVVSNFGDGVRQAKFTHARTRNFVETRRESNVLEISRARVYFALPTNGYRQN